MKFYILLSIENLTRSLQISIQIYGILFGFRAYLIWHKVKLFREICLHQCTRARERFVAKLGWVNELELVDLFIGTFIVRLEFRIDHGQIQSN